MVVACILIGLLILLPGMVPYLERLEQRRIQRHEQAQATYRERILLITIDNLLLKTFELDQRLSEEDFKAELEIQKIDNDHWRQELIQQGGTVPDLSIEILLESFNQKIEKLKLPQYIR